MSNVIDNKIVEMSFDNRNFEKNVKESMSTLQKLKDSLNLKGAEKSFESLQHAADKFNFNSFSKEIDTATSSYGNFLNTVGNVYLIKKSIDVLDSFESKIVSVAKSMSIDQITAGWGKYEEKTQAVQTIMSATKKPIEEVNKYLEKLNWFSDETSYSFTDMTNSVGKFTSVGVDLETSVKAIMGISNWAAKSGQGVNEASRAMYNLAQALSVGSVKLMDWKSIENANMATTEFKQAALDAAVSLGKLRKEGDKYKTVSKGTVVTTENFSQTLNEAWLSSEVLLKTLGRYGGYAEDLYDFIQATGDGSLTASEAMQIYNGDVDELGDSSFRAAQEAKTLTDAINATKDAVSSGWAKTFELIFGNYEEAKGFWSDMATSLWDIFAGGAEDRNSFLETAFGKSPREILEETVETAEINSEAFYSAVGEALKRNHWDLGDLTGEYESLAEFAKDSDAWKSPEIMAEALTIISENLDLQNGSVDQITERWRGLEKQIADAGGSVEEFEEEVKRQLDKAGYDVNPLIEHWGSLENVISNENLLSSDIIGDTFDEMSKRAVDYTKTIKGGNVTLEEFEKIFQDVYKNVYGVGEERQKKLTEAGYDYEKVQALIAKRANGQKITEEDLAGLRSEEVVKVEKLSEKYSEMGSVYRHAGDNAQEMAREILESGSDLNYLANNLDGLSGKEILFDSILSVLNQINDVISVFREEWNRIFMSNPEGLLKALAAFNEFIHSFDLGEEQLDDLSSMFGGLLSILNLLKEVAGTVFAVISPLFGKAGDGFKKILSILGNLGDALTEFNDGLISVINEFLYGLPAKISSAFETVKSKLEEIKKLFPKLFGGEGEESGKKRKKASKYDQLIDKVTSGMSIFTKMGNVISYYRDKLSDIIHISPVLGKVYDSVSSKIKKFVEILQNSKIYQRLKEIFDTKVSPVFSKGIDYLKGKIEALKDTITKTELFKKVSEFFSSKVSPIITESFDKIADKVKSVYGFLKEKIKALKDLFTNLFSAGGSGNSKIKGSLGSSSSIFDRITEKFNNFRKAFGDTKVKAFEIFGKVIESVGKKVSAFFKILKSTGPAALGVFALLLDTGAVLKIIEIVNKLKETFSKGDDGFKLNGILQLSIAIGVVAGSIAMLANLDMGKLQKGAIAVGAIFVALVTAFKLISKDEKEIFKGSTTLGDFGKAIIELAGALTILSRLTAGKIVKGVFGMGALFTIMVVSFNSLSKAASSISFGKNILKEMSEALKNMATTVYILGTMDMTKIGRGLAGLGGIMVELGALLVAINKWASQVAIASWTIKSIGVAILLLTGSVAIIGNMDINSALKGVGGVFALCGGLSVIFLALSKLTGPVAIGSLAIISIGVAIKLLASVVKDLASVNNLQNGFIALAELIGAFTVVALGITAFGVIAGPALIALAEFTVFNLALVGALSLLGKLSGENANLNKGLDFVHNFTESLTEMFNEIGSMAKSMLLSVGMFSAIGAMAPLMIAGITSLGVVITGLGALNKNDGFDDLVKSGGKTLIIFGKIIGRVFGELIGELTSSITGKLPDVGQNLSDFIVKLTPFLAGIKLVSAMHIERSVKELVRSLVILAGADLADFVVRKLTGKGPLQLLGEELAEFGKSFHKFIVAIGALQEDTKNSKSAVLDTERISAVLATVPKLVELSKMDFSGTSLISAMFSGNLMTFAWSVEAFGKSYAVFADALVGSGLTNNGKQIEKLDQGKIDLLDDIIAQIAALAKITPPPSVPGWLKNLTGDNSLAAWGQDLAAFGPQFLEFADGLLRSGFTKSVMTGEGEDQKTEEVKIEPLDSDRVDLLKKVVESLASLSEVTPPTKVPDWLKNLTGDNSFAEWGKDLAAFGPKFLEFVDGLTTSGLTKTVATGTGEDAQLSEKKIEPLDSMKIFYLDSAIKSLEKLSGISAPAANPDWAQWFSGDNSLETWGDSLIEFGPKFLEFADSIIGSKLTKTNENGEETVIEPLDSAKITNLSLAITSLKKLSEIEVPTEKTVLDKFLTGDNSLENWGNQLVAFGPKFKIFAQALITSGLTTAKSENNILPGRVQEEKVSALEQGVSLLERLAALEPPPAGNFIKKWIEGDTSLETLGTQLAALGPGLGTFINSMKEFNVVLGENNEKIVLDETAFGNAERAVQILENILGLTVPEATKEAKSFLDWDLDFTGLGQGVKELGIGLGTFLKEINGFQLLDKFVVNDETSIAIAKSALEVVKEIIGLEIPKSAGFFDKIFEEHTSMSEFATGIGLLGESVRTLILSLNGYSAKVGSVDSIKITQEDIDQILKVLPLIQQLAKIKIAYVTTEEWAYFAGMVGMIGPYIREFITEFNDISNGGEINEDSIDTVKSVLPIISVLAEASADIQGKGYNKFGEFGSAIGNLIDPIKGFIIGINEAFASDGIKKETIENLLSIVPLISTIASIGLKDVEDEMSFSVTTLFEDISEGIIKVTSTLEANPINPDKATAFTSFVNELESIDESAFSTFVTSFSTDYGNFSNLFNGAKDKYYNIGKDIAEGLANGISAGTTEFVIPAANAMAAAATIETKKEIDSNSPSKVFEKIGGYIGQGLAIGIKGSQNLVDKAAVLLGDTAIDGTRDTLDCHSPSDEFIDIGANGIDKGLAKGMNMKNGLVEKASEFLGSTAIDSLTDNLRVPSIFGGGFVEDLLGKFFGNDDKIGEKTAEELKKDAADAAEAVVEGTVKGAKDGSEEAMDEVVQDDIAGLADTVRNEFDSRKEDMVNSAQDLVMQLAKEIEANNATFKKVGKALGDATYQGIMEGFGGKNDDNSPVKKLIDFFDTLKKFTESANADQYVERFKYTIEQIVGVINGIEINEEVLTPFQQFLNSLADASTAFSGDNAASINQFVSNLFTAIENSSSRATESANVIVTAIWTVFENSSGIFQNIGFNIVLSIATGMLTNLPAVASACNTIIAQMSSSLSGGGDQGIQSGAEFIHGVSTGLADAGAMALLNAAVDEIRAAISRSVPDGYGMGEAWCINYANAIAANWWRVEEAMTGKFSGGGGSGGKSSGKNMIDGVVQGLKDGVSNVIDTVTSIFHSVSEAADKANNANSPSKLYAEKGRFVDEGYAIGIRDNADKPIHAVEDMAKGTTSAFSKIISRISESVQDNSIAQPTITPVVDLSNVEKAKGSIRSAFSSNLAMQISSMQVANSMQNNALQNGNGNAPFGTAGMTFVQNNYSPKHLSAGEIYRQTKTIFAQYKNA